ncbi:MAG: energy transducer TonB [Caldimonas sp.]
MALATAPPPPEAAAAPPAPAAPPPSTYLSSGLDPPPRPLGDIDPAVPAAAGSRGGVVVLRLSINERGGVDKVEVLDSSPPGLFDASAVEAFSAARFSPGYLAGVAVKSQVTFEVRYRALGSGSEAAGKTY